MRPLPSSDSSPGEWGLAFDKFTVINVLYNESSINNLLGPRLTLMLGTWGYSLYIASFLYGFLFKSFHTAALNWSLER